MVGHEESGILSSEPGPRPVPRGDEPGAGAPRGGDLECISTAAPVADEGGYRIACRVEGELLVAHDEHEIELVGERTHHW